MNNIDLSENRKYNLIAFLLSAMGFAYIVYYIFRASTDVVLSDYIRIINSYIYDVTDLKYLFSMEAISRIPFNFLSRFVNVKLFNYSVFFDRILGVFGLFLFNFVTVKFALRYLRIKPIKYIISVVITFISFSLMSWEMILNGTGYSHFITIGLIALTYYIFDKFHFEIINVLLSFIKFDKFIPDTALPYGAIYKYSNLLIIIVAVTSIFFAGSYCVAFILTIVFFSIIEIIILARNAIGNHIINTQNRKMTFSYIRRIGLLIIVALFCLALYLISDSTGVPLVPVGFKNVTLMEVIRDNPLFPIKFLIKSLASGIIGVETFDYSISFGTINENVVYLFGILYLVIIIITLIIIFIRIKDSLINKECVSMDCNENVAICRFLPYIYMIYGFASFGLVFLARYRFVRDEYGMTSRYAIQYMFLSIGIILVLSSFIEDCVLKKKNRIGIIVAVSFIFVFFYGNIVTSTDEIWKADFRKILYNNIEAIAKDYENYPDEVLENSFEYHRGVDQIKSALSILKKNKLNVFR